MLPAKLHAVHLLAEKQPHLDLLHPARRLWRRRLQSCRLINLEQMILGLHRSEQDVPGYLIPTLYQHYSRSGNATEMRRVFYHNAEDIVSMVAIADRLNRSLASPVHTSPRASSAAAGEILVEQDWLAFGQMCENRQDFAQAESAYRKALEVLRANGDRKDAFQRLAQLLKRMGRWAEAADTWQLWLTSVPGEDPTPYVELAKYCEWQINDLEQAEMWTAWALHNIRKSPHARHFRSAAADLERRLQRIQRKRAGSQSA
jgi:tetratricopeptide (TPR) repeat protein